MTKAANAVTPPLPVRLVLLALLGAVGASCGSTDAPATDAAPTADAADSAPIDAADVATIDAADDAPADGPPAEVRDAMSPDGAVADVAEEALADVPAPDTNLPDGPPPRRASSRHVRRRERARCRRRRRRRPRPRRHRRDGRAPRRRDRARCHRRERARRRTGPLRVRLRGRHPGPADANLQTALAPLVRLPNAVTPTMLLSHTGGASLHGFTGYRPGLPLPTTDQIVLGAAPANTAAITFGPTGTWLYSGGGYLVWQAWLERASSQPLPSFVREQLLVPATALRSNYAHPQPAAEHDAACGYDPARLPGFCRLNQPEHAAAGLWTTPRDLACIGGYVATRRPDALARVLTRNLAIAGYPQRQGLGLRHRPANGVNEDAGHFYEHSGLNYGYCTQFAFFSDGRALATMDNACRGAAFLAARSLCRVLGWPCAGANLGVR